MRGSRPRKLATEDALYDCAIRALGRRMRSVAELKRLLRARAAGPETEALIGRVVARLKEQRYLNDAAYAAAYAGYRKENEKFDRRRVISGLKARGVHAEVIAKAVSAVYDASDEEKLARDFLRRKRISKPADNRAAARIFRTLLRAGFTSRTALRTLNHWDLDPEVLTALEEESE